LRQRRLLDECRLQPLEVSSAERDRASEPLVIDAVADPDEARAILRLEKLEVRGEPLLAGSLRNPRLFDD
jgi:hypothetical protein